MKIGFYLGEVMPPEIGGGSVFQINVVQELQRTFQNIECVVYYKSSQEFLFKNLGNITFLNLAYQKMEQKPFWIKKKKWIEPTYDFIFLQDKIDVLYYFMPYAFISQKIPYILTVWDIGHRSITYFPEVSTINNEFIARENLFKFAIQQAAYIVIGNIAGKEQICRYYGMDPERVKINPLPVPEHIFSLKADCSIIDKNNLSSSKYLLYPAQFWAHKNHIRLIKAMTHLCKDGFKMVFTGSNQGNIDYIKNKISEYGLEKYVLLLGFVTTSELIALYKNAYALTYASFLGPDNIPPLEAMALECPVICANFDGAKEQLQDAALFFDKLDEYSLIQQINELKNKKIRSELITKGKALVNTRKTTSYVKNIMQLLEEFAKIRECWS